MVLSREVGVNGSISLGWAVASLMVGAAIWAVVIWRLWGDIKRGRQARAGQQEGESDEA